MEHNTFKFSSAKKTSDFRFQSSSLLLKVESKEVNEEGGIYCELILMEVAFLASITLLSHIFVFATHNAAVV